jgi:hypothetical protein
MVGGTVKATELLEPPFTVTATLPVVAAVGTATAIDVDFQLVGIAAVPLNNTALLPCEAPNPEPVMVTPAPTVPDVGEIAVMTGKAVPVPVRLMVCGLLLALSVMVSVPDWGPVAVGPNVMLTMQLPWAASWLPHVLVWVYAAGVVIEEIVTAVGCLLVTVTVFATLVVVTAWLPNAKVLGLTVTGTTPLPVSETVCGLLLALSAIVKVPVRLPVAVGVSVTLTVQLAPADTEVPHVFVSA